MKQPIIFFLALIFVIGGYVLLITNFNTAPDKLNKVITTSPIDECYDDTMTAWFVEFNESQDSGADMSEADKTASKVALESFTNCEN